MKVLFVKSGNVCGLSFVEKFFKEKLREAGLADIKVESADMALWSDKPNDVQAGTGVETDGTGDLLSQASLVVVMEEAHRNFLSRFMDYACWDKIYLFKDFCRNKMYDRMQNGFFDCSVRTPDEVMDDGCSGLVEYIRSLFKERKADTGDVQSALAF